VCGGEVVGAVMLAIGSEAPDPLSAIPRGDTFFNGERLRRVDLNLGTRARCGWHRGNALAA
jgi:hypothetical protein